MSDNPADSLRRELEAALAGMFKEPGEVVFWLMPIVIAALEAARADERKKIASAIEAEHGRLAAEGMYSTENFEFCAQIARGGV